MLIVKVKICGITNYQDAQTAVDMGADIIGINFYPESPRYVEPEKAAEFIKKLPAFVVICGVFVNADSDWIRNAIDKCQLDWIQLHGDESPEFCEKFNSFSVRTIKAIRVKDENDIALTDKYFTDAVLLDAFDPEKYGGTGFTFDWNLLGHITRRVFLAGGIKPENAAEAVKTGVWGIDVCSGIESEPGKKDHEKMKLLFENIKHLKG